MQSPCAAAAQRVQTRRRRRASPSERVVRVPRARRRDPVRAPRLLRLRLRHGPRVLLRRRRRPRLPLVRAHRRVREARRQHVARVPHRLARLRRAPRLPRHLRVQRLGRERRALAGLVHGGQVVRGPAELLHPARVPRVLRRAQLLEAQRLRLLVRRGGPAVLPEEDRAEAAEAPAPGARRAEALGLRERGGGLRAPLAHAAAPRDDDDEEDERAAERHEHDLPPGERRVRGRGRRGRGRGEARHGGERRGGRGARGRGDDREHEVGEADAEPGDDAAGAAAARGDAGAPAEDLAGAGAREAGARPRAGAAGAARVAGLAGGGRGVEELRLGAGRQAAPVRQHGEVRVAAGALVEGAAGACRAVGVARQARAGGAEGIGRT